MTEDPLTLKSLKKLLAARGFGIYIYKTKFGLRAAYNLTGSKNAIKVFRCASNTKDHLKRWKCFDDFQKIHYDQLMALGQKDRIARLVVEPVVVKRGRKSHAD